MKGCALIPERLCFFKSFYPENVFTSYKNKFIVVLTLLCLLTADDSWLNLTDQDLEDMLSKYSDPDSKETGEFAGKSTVTNSVSTCKSARYTVEFFVLYSSSPD